MTDREAYMALAFFNKLPALKGLPILKQIQSPVSFFNASINQLTNYGLTAEMTGALRDFRQQWNLKAAEMMLEKEKIKIVTLIDFDYPPLLKELPDAPYALFVRGSILSLNQPTIAIVGTRKASHYGLEITNKFSGALARAGGTIISGLALGVDAAAHAAALQVNGQTIAVLGGGIDDATIYPKANWPLAQKIMAAGGAIISEFPPFFAPTKYTFPLRNRLIAGLSKATIVTEAPLKSGALITAYLALEYNRDCFAIPGDINKIGAVGSNRLISEGATCLLNPQEIINLYLPEKTFENKQAPISLSTPATLLFKKIEQIPSTIDELSEATGLDISEISSMLSLMELNGLVKNIGNGMFSV